MADAPLVLFDGVCNLCNAAINFILDRDKPGRFRFASLQSDAGRAALAAMGLEVPAGDPDTIVLIEEGRAYDRSTAALRIARHLAGPVAILWMFVVVPRVLRDAVYKVLARNRYRWFGKADACRVPTPELRTRFLG